MNISIIIYRKYEIRTIFAVRTFHHANTRFNEPKSSKQLHTETLTKAHPNKQCLIYYRRNERVLRIRRLRRFYKRPRCTCVRIMGLRTHILYAEYVPGGLSAGNVWRRVFRGHIQCKWALH